MLIDNSFEYLSEQYVFVAEEGVFYLNDCAGGLLNACLSSCGALSGQAITITKRACRILTARGRSLSTSRGSAKRFGPSCPYVTVTNVRERADSVVTLDHQGCARKDNKVAVSNKEGDMIYSDSTRSL
jgi:hypothetical protein